jgi:hypothetical protein
VVVPDWFYIYNYAPFARIGDTHLVVTSGDIVLETASAEVIRQIGGRREHFPKDTDTYQILRIFGENVVTTEGAHWRMHRKATATSFNERTAGAVFVEAVRQAQGLVALWSHRNPNNPVDPGLTTIRTVEHDTMRLALNIIGYAGFGVRLLWPGQSLPASTDQRWAKYATLEPRAGYTLSFVDAVAGLLDNMILVMLGPHSLMRMFFFLFLPFSLSLFCSFLSCIPSIPFPPLSIFSLLVS